MPLIGREPEAGETVTDAGSTGIPVVIVICPTMLHFTVVVQLKVIGPFTGAIPTPASEALCGEPGALSEMLTVPLRFPAADGENVVTMVQLAAAATFAPLMHVLVGDTVKSEGFGPPMVALLENVSTEFPVLVTTMVCDALVAETEVLPNDKLVGERTTCADITGGGAVTMIGLMPSVT